MLLLLTALLLDRFQKLVVLIVTVKIVTKTYLHSNDIMQVSASV